MTIACGVALAATGLGGCGGSSASPQQTLKQFVADWNRGDWAAMASLVDQPPTDFTAAAPALTSALHAARATYTATLTDTHGSTTGAAVTSTYALPAIGTWHVQSSMDLVKKSGHWLVQWSPQVVDPQLAAGQRLTLTYLWPARAPILGAGGVPLTSEQAQVVVGLEGSRLKDAPQAASALQSAGGTPAEIAAALSAAQAHPNFFEPVFTITEAAFQALGGNQSQLYQVPGTVFRHASSRAAITPGLAAHLVGLVGPITAQQLQQLGPPYDATSMVGQTGLEAAYEKQLAGSPGGNVSVVDGTGDVKATVATFPAKPGTPVTTSIDPTVQRAAEAALSTVAGTTALVAVNAATGEVLAAVSQPAANQFDQAIDGTFPPGSTFKVLTSAALIDAGLSPSSTASCPPTVTVDGEVFHNAEGDSPVSNLAGAFTESCNTAFVQLATANLQPASFPAAAALFGIGTAAKMGLAAATGNVPLPTDKADLAATAIGQGAVVVSPLNMAMVAASIDSGSARSPRLVQGAPDDTATPKALPAAVLAGLRPMMAAVVTNGTAAGTGLPAGTYAKTGTAEYGSGNPLPTDAWLMGYQGNIAFAVVVQNSHGNGGPVDGPIIARFLAAIH
jgi:cell division protein FtsI/penicillin-binding protein 2